MTRNGNRTGLNRRSVVFRSKYRRDGKRHVPGTVYRIRFTGGCNDVINERENVAAPHGAVAARVLDMQAGEAKAGPMFTEVRVAISAAAEPVRENDQRDSSGWARASGPVEPHRNVALPTGVVPLHVNGAKAIFTGRLSARRSRWCSRWENARQPQPIRTRNGGAHGREQARSERGPTPGTLMGIGSSANRFHGYIERCSISEVQATCHSQIIEADMGS